MSNAAGDLNDMADIVTNVEALADLKLDVSDPSGPIAVGDEMVYELRVHNRGTKSADSVGVVAYFSEGIEPISAEGGTHDISNGVVAFRPLATLAVGGEVVYRIHAKAEKTGKQMFRTEVECGTLGHETGQRRRGDDLSERRRIGHATRRKGDCQPCARSGDPGAEPRADSTARNRETGSELPYQTASWSPLAPRRVGPLFGPYLPADAALDRRAAAPVLPFALAPLTIGR